MQTDLKRLLTEAIPKKTRSKWLCTVWPMVERQYIFSLCICIQAHCRQITEICSSRSWMNICPEVAYQQIAYTSSVTSILIATVIQWDTFQLGCEILDYTQQCKSIDVRCGRRTIRLKEAFHKLIGCSLTENLQCRILMSTRHGILITLRCSPKSFWGNRIHFLYFSYIFVQ